MHLPKLIALLTLLFVSLVEGVYIYVASGNGNVTTLALTHYEYASTSSSKFVNNGYFNGAGPQRKYRLSKVTSRNTTAKLPAWLALNAQNNILYLTDGYLGGNSTLSSFRTQVDGSLVQLDSVEGVLDGAHAEFFDHGRKLAVAHYSASALQTYNITDDGLITHLQTFTYSMSKPGPRPIKQAAPHPHESVLDPTGQYLVVPDLGMDRVHVYSIDQKSGLLTARDPLVASPGSGPRHGVFTQEKIPSKNGTFNHIFYLESEIGGTVTAYRVNYLSAGQGIRFEEVPGGNYTVLAPGVEFPAAALVSGPGVGSEIHISPDGQFLISSNRRDESFNGTKQQYPPNGTSDSVTTFRIREDLGGTLDFMQAIPAGGSIPRSFAMNAVGNLAAVALQKSAKVTVMERDLDSGLFINQVAEIEVPGEVSSIVFDD